MRTMSRMLAPLLALSLPIARAWAAPSQDFAALAEDYWETQMRLSPLWATYANFPGYNDRLDDNGPDGRAEERRELERLLKGVKRLDPRALQEDQRLSWEVMKLKLESDLEADRHRLWRWTVDHMDGPQSEIPSIVEIAQPMKTRADAEALLSRIWKIPLYFDRHVANLREGLGAGLAAPRVAVQRTIDQLEEQISAPAKDTPFASAGRRLPEPLRSEYAPRIAAAVEADVYPAYRRYRDFLKTEVLPRARGDDRPGLAHIKGGKAAYRYLIGRYTTVDASAEELHRVGMEELAGIQDEMRRIAARMGHTGDVRSFLEKVKNDPANFFKSREEVFQTARRLVEKTKTKLPLYFGVLPKTALAVKRMEAYREKNQPLALYYQPPDDLSRGGIFYINTYQPEKVLKPAMTSLAVHEGVPGHHMQIAIAVEKRDLPAFRRHVDFTAFVEGWALYAERLADEMGLYEDDLSRVGMLSDQAWRACRLVVDTGLHSMGWSRRQAIDFMKANLATSEEAITVEVDRYIVWPGQALAYKVGQREIMSIRREAEKRPGFDIRAFHDAVLKNGALPMPVLRRVVLGR